MGRISGGLKIPTIAVASPEMEKLIIANLAVAPEDVRAPAKQRATVVRHRLETEGKVRASDYSWSSRNSTPMSSRNPGRKCGLLLA